MNRLFLVKLLLICFASIAQLGGANFGFAPVRYEIGPVDRFGYASLERSLGDVELEDGRKLPLRLRFSSHPDAHSVHFGQGFSMPLLESRIYPYDDWNLRLDAINGEIHYLSRENRTSDRYLTPGGALVATIKGRNTSVTHEAGWAFEYVSGSLREMKTPEGVVLLFAQRDGRVTDIRLEGGERVVTVKGRSSAECIDEIAVGEVVYRFTPGSEDPEQGRRKTPYGDSLYRWEGAEESGETFQFQNEGASISLSFQGSNGTEDVFRWNAETGHLNQVGDWAYTITPKKDPWAYAKIEREHEDGRKEMINRDYTKGLRERLYSDGRLERKHFTLASGPLHWKLRKVEEIKDGAKKVSEQRAYYDDGALMRVVDSANNITFYERDEEGKHVRTFFNDALIEEKVYGQDGRLEKRAQDIKGKWVETELRPDGQESQRFIDGDLEWYHKFDSENRIVGQFFRSGFQRRFFYPDDGDSTEKYMLYFWPDTKDYRLTKLVDNSMRWSRDKRGKEAVYGSNGEKRFLRKEEGEFKTDPFAQTIINQINKLK